MTSLWQSVLTTRHVPHPGTPKASPDRATPSYRRFGNWVNSPLCLQNSMFVDPERRPLAVARSFKYQSPPGANPELQDGVALRKPGPHHAALVLACTPAPVNGRLPGVNAALAFVLPNLAGRCNFGLQLRCQLTRVIATTPTRTRARSQSRAPPRGVKPSKSPCRRGAWSPPQWCVTAACA